MQAQPADTPLCELHVHLEGSLTAVTLRELDPQLTADAIAAAHTFSDFTGFLDAFKWVNRLLRRPEDYAIAAGALCRDLRRQGVQHAEVTLSAGVVLWKGLPLDEVYGAVREATAGEPVVWILDAVRQWGPVPAWPVVEFACAQRGNGVVAIGLGGDERTGPAEWFAEHFAYAKQRGLLLTPHAGETAGPESIWQCLQLGADRIGHGIRAIHDPVLVRHLAERRIPLEISVSSNVRTGAVASYEAHPIRQLFDAGVMLSINTDDPGLFGTTLSREYLLLRQHYGFTAEEISRLRRFAWESRSTMLVRQ